MIRAGRVGACPPTAHGMATVSGGGKPYRGRRGRFREESHTTAAASLASGPLRRMTGEWVRPAAIPPSLSAWLLSCRRPSHGKVLSCNRRLFLMGHCRRKVRPGGPLPLATGRKSGGKIPMMTERCRAAATGAHCRDTRLMVCEQRCSVTGRLAPVPKVTHCSGAKRRTA